MSHSTRRSLHALYSFHLIGCAVGALCGLAILSCTSPYQVRGVEQPLDRELDLATVESSFQERVNLEARSIERYPEFSLGIIEFTDLGASNPEQERQVFRMLEREGGNGALIVVFAHGWHHGPRVCDRDLACFRRVLQALSKVDRLQRRVLGVYLGWRGQAVNSKVGQYFTFWNRKEVAQHIGRTGGKEVLLRLDDLHHRLGEDKVTMVTVGHSFGGALVFSAVKGKMIGNLMGLEGGHDAYRVARAAGDRNPDLDGPHVKALRARFGDLVVLVNPAIEAGLYTPFFEDHRNGADEIDEQDLIGQRLPYDQQWPYSEDQLPVLLAVASTADKAVGRLFPLGRWAWTLSHPWALFYGDSADRTGLGRYAPHHTHTLQLAPGRKATPHTPPAASACECSKDFFSEARQLEPIDLHTTVAQPLGDLILTPVRKDWDTKCPYWVVETGPEVIDEHSDIFNETFVSFLVQYIQAYDRAKVIAPNKSAE